MGSKASIAALQNVALWDTSALKGVAAAAAAADEKAKDKAPAAAPAVQAAPARVETLVSGATAIAAQLAAAVQAPKPVAETPRAEARTATPVAASPPPAAPAVTNALQGLAERFSALRDRDERHDNGRRVGHGHHHHHPHGHGAGERVANALESILEVIQRLADKKPKPPKGPKDPPPPPPQVVDSPLPQERLEKVLASLREGYAPMSPSIPFSQRASATPAPGMVTTGFWQQQAPTALRAYQTAAQAQVATAVLANAQAQAFSFTRPLGVI